jgi:hypothetical protein
VAVGPPRYGPGVSPTPSEIGARAEFAVANALVAAGKRVFVPVFGSDGRIDLIFEDGDGLHRVQCKTARVDGGALYFRTCSNTRNVTKGYGGEVDFFGVFSPELDQVFLVPVADVPASYGYLRLAPTRNGQARRVRWAHGYRI